MKMGFAIWSRRLSHLFIYLYVLPSAQKLNAL